MYKCIIENNKSHLYLEVKTAVLTDRLAWLWDSMAQSSLTQQGQIVAVPFYVPSDRISNALLWDVSVGI